MSQFVLVTGLDAESASATLRRAVALYREIAGLSPMRVVEGPNAALAVFDSAMRPGGVQLLEQDDGVAVGVGHWFRGETAQGDLAPLLEAAGADDDTLTGRLAEYDGCFAFLLLADHRLTIVTDPLGRLHVYWSQWGEMRLVCTSSLILAALIRPTWHMPAVREFLALGYVMGVHSLFRGIEKYRPGSITRENPGQPPLPVTRTYWRVADWVEPDFALGGIGAVERLASALRHSVDCIHRAYGHPALDLTGGFDSRALLGAALREVPDERISTVVSGSPSSNDVRAARLIAETFGLNFSRYDAAPSDAGRWWALAERALPLVDGEYDVFEYASVLAVHERLAAHFDASVNGSGGEVCRGYWWELLLPFLGWRGHFNSRRIAAARFATDPWAENIWAESFDTCLTDHMARMIDDADGGLSHAANTARMDNVYLMIRMQRWQGRLASATGRLWPCFSPFLMKAPMQAALQAGVSSRIGNRMARRLIAHLDPRLADLPMASGVPAAPLTWRNAARFRNLPAIWTRRARARAFRTIGGRAGWGTRPARPGFIDDAFRDWWAEPLTAPLFRAGSLPAEAGVDAFSSPAHLGRLTTLELVARVVEAGGGRSA